MTLREAREYRGLSREKVAPRIGISTKTLERYEKSNRAKRYLVEQLAELYGVEADKLEYEAA